MPSWRERTGLQQLLLKTQRESQPRPNSHSQRRNRVEQLSVRCPRPRTTTPVLSSASLVGARVATTPRGGARRRESYVAAFSLAATTASDCTHGAAWWRMYVSNMHRSRTTTSVLRHSLVSRIRGAKTATNLFLTAITVVRKDVVRVPILAQQVERHGRHQQPGRSAISRAQDSTVMREQQH